eukprot:5825552-Karenia_brevis.AAC.1
MSIVRRVADYAEMGGTSTHLVRLEWEKAFDRIRHDKLIESMKRMKIYPKLQMQLRTYMTTPPLM